MGLKIEPKVTRIGKNLRISQPASDYLDDLAIAYNTTQGRIMEALLTTYGPALMRDAGKGETK